MYTNYPPDKLKSLRIRSLLTQSDVQSLTGLSFVSLIKAEKGRSRLQKRNLDKLLTLYATRIARIEKMERIWDGPLTGQVQSPRVVERNGSARGPYKAKQSTKHAG